MIGFIGIGQMGQHMARRVLEAGFGLVVHDVKKASADLLLEQGALWADTPQALAESCQTVISCLPTPPVVENVVLGVNGLKDGWKNGDIYIDMSTNSPTTVRKIAAEAEKKGVSVLDAPVSGGTRGAEGGTLTIMVGGRLETLEKSRKILETMGSKIFHVGDVGCGNIAKLVNNMIGLACGSITAEGFVLGLKAGINPKALYAIIKVSTGNNWSLDQYPNTVFKGNFEPGFKISLAYKDIGLALSLGRDLDLSLPVAESVKNDLKEAMDAGLAEKGVDAVILNLEKMAGIQVRTNK